MKNNLIIILEQNFIFYCQNFNLKFWFKNIEALIYSYESKNLKNNKGAKRIR